MSEVRDAAIRLASSGTQTAIKRERTSTSSRAATDVVSPTGAP